jgi:hypothetical protein
MNDIKKVIHQVQYLLALSCRAIIIRFVSLSTLAPLVVSWTGLYERSTLILEKCTYFKNSITEDGLRCSKFSRSVFSK